MKRKKKKRREEKAEERSRRRKKKKKKKKEEIRKKKKKRKKRGVKDLGVCGPEEARALLADAGQLVDVPRRAVPATGAPVLVVRLD
jgi:hypothetical protein